MLFSNNRKLSLSGWLQENNTLSYFSPLRLQKFLFFYEAFSKADGDYSDFSHLKGYKRGPVFSQVWGDYTKDRAEFDTVSLQTYHNKSEQINEKRAQRASFIVSSLSENELSSLTHQFNIWNAKYQRIMSGEQQVELFEKDFSKADYAVIQSLEQMFPEEMIQNCDIIAIDKKYFVFSKKELARLTEQHFDILASLSDHLDLHNPVYVEIDNDGRLCVD